MIYSFLTSFYLTSIDDVKLLSSGWEKEASNDEEDGNKKDVEQKGDKRKK